MSNKKTDLKLDPIVPCTSEEVHCQRVCHRPIEMMSKNYSLIAPNTPEKNAFLSAFKKNLETEHTPRAEEKMSQYLEESCL
ncbi:hypothetical protein DID77_03100 [Candidatus Marinamargulisbacteria bacterium SCGC AG-439-L15]|nr:hypothetical protein DID77_03100 [Candidatus Marinamargulisbacteria bacterium SCGC AG-439-L15]